LKKLLGLLALTGFLGNTAFGITLNQAEELAIKNYPKLKELQALSESSKEQAKAIKRERFGTINVFTSYTTYNKNLVLTPLYYMPSPKNPPPFDSRKVVYGIDFSVPLYLGGTIGKRVEIEKLKSNLFKTLKEDAKWQIKFNVDSAYLSYLRLEEIKKALKDYEKSLQKLRSDVEAGVKAGKFARVDLLKVDYSLQDVRAKIKEVEKNQETLKTVLETLTGKKIEKIEPYKVDYTPKNYSLNSLYLKALSSNNSIKSKKKEVLIAQKGVELTKGKYGLKLLLDGNYARNYGFDSGENTGIGSVSVKIAYPILEWGRKERETLSKELIKIAKEKELRDSELSLKRELSKAINSLESIQSDIEAYRTKLAYAKEVERIERLKYESGKGDMDHLLLAEAHRFLTEAQLKGAYYSWEIEKRRIEALLEAEDE